MKDKYVYILLAIIAAVLGLLVGTTIARMDGEEPTAPVCADGEVQRVTVIYPDGDEGEPKTTYDCVKVENK